MSCHSWAFSYHQMKHLEECQSLYLSHCLIFLFARFFHFFFPQRLECFGGKWKNVTHLLQRKAFFAYTIFKNLVLYAFIIQTRMFDWKIHLQTHERIFHILAIEVINDVISRFFTAVCASSQFFYVMQNKIHGGLKVWILFSFVFTPRKKCLYLRATVQCPLHMVIFTYTDTMIQGEVDPVTQWHWKTGWTARPSWVILCFYFKTNPCVKPFIWKWVWFAR